jgi:aspartyl-tRNA(Asn)/glutamyl-tRNA(Gln) amidotransferase subunit B
LEAVAALPGRPLDVHLLDLDKARLVAFVQKYTVRQVDALALFGQPENHALFEAAVQAGGDPSAMMKWLLGPVAAWRNQSTEPCLLNGAHLVALESLVVDGEISRATARTLLPEVATTGAEPADLVATKGLRQVGEASVILDTILLVLAAEPEAVSRYQNGNKRVFGFLMGAVMRAFNGQADAVQVRTLLAEALEPSAATVVSRDMESES